MKCLASNSEYERNLKKSNTNETCFLMSIAIASVLTDKLHFGKEKTVQTIKQFYERFEAITAGYIDFEDLRKTLVEEYGIEIKRKEDE